MPKIDLKLLSVIYPPAKRRPDNIEELEKLIRDSFTNDLETVMLVYAKIMKESYRDDTYWYGKEQLIEKQKAASELVELMMYFKGQPAHYDQIKQIMTVRHPTRSSSVMNKSKSQLRSTVIKNTTSTAVICKQIGKCLRTLLPVGSSRKL